MHEPMQIDWDQNDTQNYRTDKRHFPFDFEMVNEMLTGKLLILHVLLMTLRANIQTSINSHLKYRFHV